MFDYHVHVAGTILRKYSQEEVKEKLKASLKNTNIEGFIGIVPSGTLFKYKQYTDLKKMLLDFFDTLFLDIGLLEDFDNRSLNTVKELKGEPAIFIYPYVLSENKKTYFTRRRTSFI